MHRCALIKVNIQAVLTSQCQIQTIGQIHSVSDANLTHVSLFHWHLLQVVDHTIFEATPAHTFLIINRDITLPKARNGPVWLGMVGIQFTDEHLSLVLQLRITHISPFFATSCILYECRHPKLRSILQFRLLRCCNFRRHQRRTHY